MNRQDLARLGWRENSLAYLEKYLQEYKDVQAYQEQYQSVFFFASPLFQKMWFQELQNLDEAVAQDLLRGVMKILLMPSDLSGTCEETAFLLSRMAPACPPHSPFWSSFSRVVQVAFAQDSLASKEGDQLLKRQIHQFRYLLSAYQAQWIREHYAKTGQTDEEALQAYLQETKGIKIDAYAAARLHNKVYVDQDGQLAFPSRAQAQLNFKVLLNFHTEYILDQDGQFLNEVDPYQISENGIVNGASFNYGLARGYTHKDLDIDPVKPWDPPFRKKVLYQQGVRYLAPKNDRSIEGYWSRKGTFAQGGKSYKQQVAKRVRSFLRGIPRLRWRVLLQNGLHRIL
ncbi:MULTISPECIES: DUF3114 domain-containing protein [unclassified Streptococcus]|uniref:DUF3114 domain-containing protein n=3 Tax=Streptococcus TaxID=1301 RepID=UPI0020C8A0F8|nr:MULTISPECIES: DUF3114 domain-containing protein [unclassified Streptococcus]MCP8963207.1 DUF3114 domain-containing protein [Streptococcus sp. CF8_St5-12]MCP8981107.1 DUF3114 domain-containing protein [Streptococcus sp. CF8_St5-16]MCP9040130.1 DUF3114 domain-containing protein [Streptococcus sp. CF8_St5-11]